MNRLQLYIENLINNKKTLEFQIQELVNSDLLYEEFKHEMDNLLNKINLVDVKINLLTTYLKPDNDDNI